MKLDTKWVFANKSMEENETDRFKGRLLVRGFALNGLDEIYSHLARMTAIRALFILGKLFLDVNIAFLNG